MKNISKLKKEVNVTKKHKYTYIRVKNVSKAKVNRKNGFR